MYSTFINKFSNHSNNSNASHEINMFGVPDTMSCNDQFVPDNKEIITNLSCIIIVKGLLFEGL